MTSSDGGVRGDGGSLRQLFAVAQDGVELLRQELRLARQETVEKLAPAGQAGGMLLAGGLLAAFGSRYLGDAVVRALATRMPHWLASLLFGAGLAAGGVVLLRRGGRAIANVDLVPEKTIKSLREDKAWLLHQIKSRLI